LPPMPNDVTHGCQMVTIEKLAETGRKRPAAPVPPREDALATICYTSGTTVGAVYKVNSADP
jgi:long-subunit acyl-CoA synthetase (AMP-forming)